jgi:hypothetical protein
MNNKNYHLSVTTGRASFGLNFLFAGRTPWRVSLLLQLALRGSDRGCLIALTTDR